MISWPFPSSPCAQKTIFTDMQRQRAVREEQAGVFADDWIYPASLTLLEVLIYLSQDMYLPALPSVGRAFGVGAPFAQWTMTAWLLGASTMHVALGHLSDHIGRRPVLLAGAGVFAIASAASAAAPTYAAFIACRVVQGGCLCAVLVAGYACIHEMFSPTRCVTILARMNGATVLAPALGPLLGAGLLTFAPWNFIFVLLSAMTLPALALLAWSMPETWTPARPAPTMTPLCKRGTSAHERRTRSMVRPLGAFCAVFGMLVSWNASAPFFFVEESRSGLRFALAQGAMYAAFIVGTRFAVRASRGDTGYACLVSRGIRVGAVGVLLALLAQVSKLGMVATLASFALTMAGAGFLFPILFRFTIEQSSATVGISMGVFFTATNLVGAGATALVPVVTTYGIRAYLGYALALLVAAELIFRDPARRLFAPVDRRR